MMRRTLAGALTLAFGFGFALDAAAQVSIIYQKRTKKSFLQVTVGNPYNYYTPWYVPTHPWNAPTYTVLPTPYIGGSYFVPSYGAPYGWTPGVYPTYPAGYPWGASSPATPPPAPTGLTSKYTKYLPPASLAKGAAKGLEALALIERGLQRLKAGQVQAALESLRGALMAGPDDARLDAIFGLAVAMAKDYGHADKAMRSAIAGAATMKEALLPDPKSMLESEAAWNGLLKALEAEKGASGKLTLALLRASVGDKARAREALEKLPADDSVVQRLRAVIAD